MAGLGGPIQATMPGPTGPEPIRSPANSRWTDRLFLAEAGLGGGVEVEVDAGEGGLKRQAFDAATHRRAHEERHFLQLGLSA